MTTNRWHGGWRRDGLIWRPVGVTAEDRFGDVVADQTRAARRAELHDLHHIKTRPARLDTQGDTAA